MTLRRTLAALAAMLALAAHQASAQVIDLRAGRNPQGKTWTSGVTCPPVAAPVGGAGSVYTCATDGALYTWDGSEWNAAGSGSLPEFTFENATGGGTYTLANSGIVWKNANGDEIGRLWMTDPDFNNWNSGNVYLGFEAGLNQPTDNTDAGYTNVAVGWRPLASITTGSDNVAIGSEPLVSLTSGGSNIALGLAALFHLTEGDTNIGIGPNALGLATTGTSNIGIGWNSCLGVTTETNVICLGTGAASTTSNTAVIGNASVTDVYFGSTSSAAYVRPKGMVAKIADIDAGDFTAPALAGTGAGNVSNGTHRYKFAYGDYAATPLHTGSSGTATTAVTVTDNSVNGKVTVTIPYACESNYPRVFVYRDKDSDGIYKLVGDSDWSCETTFEDNVADGSLGATMPTDNTTINGLTFTGGMLSAPFNADTWGAPLVELAPGVSFYVQDARSTGNGKGISFAGQEVPGGPNGYYAASRVIIRGGNQSFDDEGLTFIAAERSGGTNGVSDMLFQAGVRSGTTAGRIKFGISSAKWSELWVNGEQGVSASGAGGCTITEITLGVITAATCAP